MPSRRIENTKYAMDIVQSAATVIALILGGIWTYHLFIEQRQEQPRLKIDHKISQRRMPNGETLLSVDEVLSNPGTTLVVLRSSETRIIQLLPLPPGITKEDLTAQHELPDIVGKPDKWPVLRDTQRPNVDRVLVAHPALCKFFLGTLLLGSRHSPGYRQHRGRRSVGRLFGYRRKLRLGDCHSDSERSSSDIDRDGDSAPKCDGVDMLTFDTCSGKLHELHGDGESFTHHIRGRTDFAQ